MSSSNQLILYTLLRNVRSGRAAIRSHNPEAAKLALQFIQQVADHSNSLAISAAAAKHGRELRTKLEAMQGSLRTQAVA